MHRAATKTTAAARIAATAIAGSLLLTACGGNPGDIDAAGAEPPEGTWNIGDEGHFDPGLAAEIREIAEKYDGEAAVALALPGAESGHGPVIYGELSDTAAWSTSKVPVAIASLGANEWVADLVPPMISESDNDAAESMWVSLGGETAAAESVNEVLRAGGDSATEFEAWLAPGDTEWELADQAAFGANLPCLDGAEPVLEAMGDIVDYQSYGLGDIAGSRFKGGWGPDGEGGYLIRQFGVIPAEGGDVGVAIAARPGDGTDDTGRDMLDELAAAIAEHMPHGASCLDHPVSTSARSGVTPSSAPAAGGRAGETGKPR